MGPASKEQISINMCINKEIERLDKNMAKNFLVEAKFASKSHFYQALC